MNISAPARAPRPAPAWRAWHDRNARLARAAGAAAASSDHCAGWLAVRWCGIVGLDLLLWVRWLLTWGWITDGVVGDLAGLVRGRWEGTWPGGTLKAIHKHVTLGGATHGQRRRHVGGDRIGSPQTQREAAGRRGGEQ